MKRITVIGTGFAALTAVRRLRALDRDAEITVLGRRPEFIYLPSLIWIPSGLREPEDLVLPLAGFFRRQRVTFQAAEVTGLHDGGRVVVTAAGPVENDGLVIASGGRFLKKLPGVEHAITPCEGVAAAMAIRHRLAALAGGTIAVGFATNPNEPAAMRGGPMFEFLFGLHTQLLRCGRRQQFKLVFFSPAAEPGKRLGQKAMQRLLEAMAARQIGTHLGHKLKGFEAGRVMTEGGDIPADLILFMPGMTGDAWLDHTALPRSPGGLVQADGQCRVSGFERVYVAGDVGSFPGPEWMPKQAHMADLQARTAAENLLAELAGGAPQKRFRVELACIVDTLDRGILVARTPKHSLLLPSSRLWHLAKRAMEWWYLRPYR